MTPCARCAAYVAEILARYQVRACVDCGQRIVATSPNAKRCRQCAIIARRAYHRAYAQRRRTRTA